ncbi:uracil permease, partial [bacterium]|nr:uracil permease [bacterium]
GALALIKVCDPVLMTIAAGSAISLSFIGKINALLKTIPVPVLGGIMILLFGMIASIGIQTLVKNKVDFSKNRMFVIASVILVVGIGNLVLDVGYFQIGGIGLAGLCGVILNLIIPEEK